MRLLELEIRRLPGIERAYRLDPEQLGAGVHVVYGPNGVGKSSILRALRALWWPEGSDGHGVSVTARFEHAGRTWRAERDGASVRWQCDGERAEPPTLPDGHLDHCFLIGLDDLAADGDASWFTERVRVALAGDYDVRAARRKLFELRPMHGHAQAKAWEEARVALARLEREQRGLLEQQLELQELEGELAIATAAQAELARLELARELATQRRELRGVELRLGAYPAGMARLPHDAAERLDQLESDIASLLRRCEQRERECAQQADRQKGTRLGEPLPDAQLAEQRERLLQLRRAEEDLDGLEVELAELEARSQAAGAGAQGEPDAAEARERAVQALRAWLAAPAPAPTRGLRWLPHAVAGLAVLALGVQVSPLWFALLALLLIDLVWRGRRASAGTPREAWRAQFEHTRLAQPQSWDTAGVELRLRELERRAAEFEQAELVARGDLAGRRARRVSLEAQRDERADALSAWLAGHDEAPGADHGAFERALAELEARSRTWQQAHEREAAARADLLERRAELEEARGRLAQLFAPLGLQPDQRAELYRWLETRGEWQNLDRRRASLVEGIERAEARAAAGGGVLDLPLEELDARLAEARERAAGREGLKERSVEISTLLAQAGRARVLEEAQVRAEEARAELDEAWQSAALALVGRQLVDDIEGEHALTARPPVLESARELFALFTRGRYALDVRDREGEALLRAEDSSHPGRGLAPGELSDGTRAQLLLAIRLAHAQHASAGMRLPLFLDDALATSDAERTREVAASLFDLSSREELQVFVLLRDASDARLIADCGAGARLLDLAALRGQQSALRDRARLALPQRRAIPDLVGTDPLEWARSLGVQAPDPWSGVEAAHLYWLLVEDRELLRELLSWGVERLGTLRELIAADAAGFLDSEQRERVERAARLFEAVRRGWLVGRGLPLSREVLESAGVSVTFLERLTELSQDLGLNSRRLIAAIEQRSDERTKGFRHVALENLRSNLEQSGHLDPRDELDEQQAWLQLLSDLRESDRGEPLALRARFEFLRARFDEAQAP